MMSNKINLLPIVTYIQDELKKVDLYSRNICQIIAFFILPEKERRELFDKIFISGLYSSEIQEFLQFFEDIPEKRKEVAVKIYNNIKIKNKIDNFIEFLKVNENINISKLNDFMSIYALIFDLENKNPKFYGLKGDFF